MITIGQPIIKENGDRVCLVSHVSNEGEHKELDVYFSVEPQYREYLCDETADAFVLPVLLRAVVSNQDIRVDAPMSEKLYHNLRYGVLYALSHARKTTPKVYGLKPLTTANNKIYISCSTLVSNNYHAKGVGTGCSLGVDSFSVIKKYLLDNDCLPSYKITHFACFNVGAFGSFNTEETRQSFYKEVERLESFAQKLGIPVISVDTNLHELYPERNFDWCHTFLNMGCVLSLQKLFGKYLYASSVPVSEFEFSFGYSGHYEPFLLPHLSTESTELIPADSEKSRSEKVHFIMDDDIVKQNINVCIKEQSANDGIIQIMESGAFRNCGHCEKCMRTMLQLDIYGRLNDYKEAFDISGWSLSKDNYVAKVLARRNETLMYKDLANSIEKESYYISPKMRRISHDIIIKNRIKSMLSSILSVFK